MENATAQQLLVLLPRHKEHRILIWYADDLWPCFGSPGILPSFSFDVKRTEIPTSNLPYGKCHSSASFGPTSSTQKPQNVDMICQWCLAVFWLTCHASFIFVWRQMDRNSNIKWAIWKMPQLGTFWSYFQHTKITERRYDMSMMFGSVLACLPCFLHLRLISNGPKCQHQMGNMENTTARHLLILLPAHKNHRT